MTYKDVLDAKTRLTILRYLAGANGRSMNLSIMKMSLQKLAIRVSKTKLLEHFDWLAERGLIKKSVVEFGVVIAEITMFGMDVSLDDEQCEGVERPSPD